MVCYTRYRGLLFFVPALAAPPEKAAGLSKLLKSPSNRRESKRYSMVYLILYLSFSFRLSDRVFIKFRKVMWTHIRIITLF